MMMKQNEADRLANNLFTKFGLPVKATVQSDNDGHRIILVPEDVHPNEAFQVKINVGWRSLYIELLPGKFAADFLQEMANCSHSKKQILSIIANEILNEKASLDLKINGTSFDPLIPTDWPLHWRSLFFSLKKSPLEINTDNYELTEYLINLWVERFFGCIIALSPVEEVEIEPDTKGFPEGSLLRVVVNRYERNRYNRTMCINFHGSDCKVCGISFGNIYGELGEGFIHVHHIVPVSQLGSNYIINPIYDLVPVCPNCHSMLHKRTPPFSIEELKHFIN